MEKHLSIVAHEDDDLLFQAPDTAQAVRRGVPTRVVFVTAGEFNGNGVTREEYAESRRQGACAAYARMAGVANVWSRQIKVFNGRNVELDVLTAKPTVEIVVLGLPDGNDSLQLQAFPNMWTDPTVVVHTIVYPGSPVIVSYNYTRSDLLAALVSIMQDFAPTVVSAQDDSPDPRLREDHGDHIATAKFVAAALTTFAGVGGGRPQLVANRCYNISECGANLTAAVTADKSTSFNAYTPFDTNTGTEPAVWMPRAYYRWGLGTAWAGSDGAGRVHAFSVQGGSVWNWRQTAANGAWVAPKDIGGGPIAPTLAVGMNQDGRVQVFGVSLTSHDIVTSYQIGADGVFSAWLSLGNPNGTGGQYTGVPTVGANSDGRMQLFAKNSGGGVSTIYQTAINGVFSSWLDFGGGPDIQEAPAVVTLPDGRMMMFAATRTSVLKWTQNSPNGGWSAPSVLVNDTVTSAPTAVLNADGRAEVFYRSTQGAVHTVYQTGGGAWTTSPTSLGGDGVGGIATLRAPGIQGRIFLVARNAGGAVSANWQLGPNASFAGWTAIGGIPSGTPSMAADANGLPLALLVGTDGSVLTSTAVGTPAVAFGPWQVTA